MMELESDEGKSNYNCINEYKNKRRVGLIYDQRMCKHRTPDGDDHPENPDRSQLFGTSSSSPAFPKVEREAESGGKLGDQDSYEVGGGETKGEILLNLAEFQFSYVSPAV